MSFLLLMAFMLVVILLGVPLAFAIGGVALLGNWFYDATSFARVAQTQFSALDSFVLLAIPFFILAGNIMLRGNMARPLVDFMGALTRGITGGGAVGAVGACSIFGALTGSSAASAAALTPVLVPGLERQGYERRFVCGLIAAGGTLGIMIPPSIVFVIYGSITGTSVATLFLAGVIPGIFLASLLALTTWYISRRRGYGSRQPFDRVELGRSFLVAAPALFMPVLVLGGIYSGIFTPTEAAAVSVLYAIIACRFIYRSIGWRDLPKIFMASAETSAVILIILAASLGIGLLAALLGLPDALADYLVSLDLGKWQFLLMVSMVLIILGCFFDGITLLVLLTPLLLPALNALDIDLIHFAIVLTASIEIAAITPPIGFNLFVISSATSESIGDIARGVLPLAVALFVGLIFLLFFPVLSTILI